MTRLFALASGRGGLVFRRRRLVVVALDKRVDTGFLHLLEGDDGGESDTMMTRNARSSFDA